MQGAVVFIQGMMHYAHTSCISPIFEWVMSAWGTPLQSSGGNTAVSLLEQDHTFKTGFKRMACCSVSLSSLSFFPLWPWSRMDSLFPFFHNLVSHFPLKRDDVTFCWHRCEITWYMGTIWVKTAQPPDSEQKLLDSAWQTAKPNVLQRLSVDLSFCFTNFTWTCNSSS